MVRTFPQLTDETLGVGDGVDAHSFLHGQMYGVWENVLAHGAVGDGVTDDTDAFQSAVAADRPIFVPRPAAHYILSDQLHSTSATGIRMHGGTALGTGPRILLQDFPSNTDVFRMSHASFPQLVLRNLFFDHTVGNAPRDFFRQEVTEFHGIDWKDVYITNLDGLGFNSPIGIQTVSAKFNNVHVINCAGGGMYLANPTATKLTHCRLTNAAAGAAFDLDIGEGTGASGVTLDCVTFEGSSPGAVDHDRARLTSIQGLTLITPYVEWTTGAATGTLRNFVLTGCSDVAMIGGTGVVTPSGTPDLTAIILDQCTNVSLIQPPIATWGGNGAASLVITGGSGIFAVVADVASKISVDSVAAPYTTIYNSGRLMRYENMYADPHLAGATPDSKGAAVALFTNASPTNVTNLLGGAAGHVITIVANDGNTTLVHGAGGDGYFFLRGGANYNLPAQHTITLTYAFGVWRESSR